MLQACQIHAPALARYIHYKYGTKALLHTRRQSFLSQEGTHQGDPLGMLLFYLVAQPLVLYIQAIFGHSLTSGWRMTEMPWPQLMSLRTYTSIKSKGPPQGLHMKVTKTKVWRPTMLSDILETFDCNVLCNRDGTAAGGMNSPRRSIRLPFPHKLAVFKICFEN